MAYSDEQPKQPFPVTPFGFVIYLLLLGVHWGWRFPSLGATLGMLAGIVACLLTCYIWRYPLSMHTAF